VYLEKDNQFKLLKLINGYLPIFKLFQCLYRQDLQSAQSVCVRYTYRSLVLVPTPFKL